MTFWSPKKTEVANFTPYKDSPIKPPPFPHKITEPFGMANGNPPRCEVANETFSTHLMARPSRGLFGFSMPTRPGTLAKSNRCVFVFEKSKGGPRGFAGCFREIGSGKYMQSHWNHKPTYTVRRMMNRSSWSEKGPWKNQRTISFSNHQFSVDVSLFRGNEKETQPRILELPNLLTDFVFNVAIVILKSTPWHVLHPRDELIFSLYEESKGFIRDILSA